ncbi:MAG TPA: pyridoxamine 5'-phosphate oxidase family protein [Noviherbaspirillum sp.]
MPDAEPILDPSHAAFLERGVGMSIAACESDGIPTIVRGTGCRVSADRRCVTVFVSAAQAAPVIRCIRANGNVAVVFSEPSTHRTVQLKGKDAHFGVLEQGDLQRIADYRDAFIAQVATLGYDKALIRYLFAYPSEDIVTLSFCPTEAFSQTPGPHAGEPLRRRT